MVPLFGKIPMIRSEIPGPIFQSTPSVAERKCLRKETPMGGGYGLSRNNCMFSRRWSRKVNPAALPIFPGASPYLVYNPAL
jgi:hypothetical protein